MKCVIYIPHGIFTQNTSKKLDFVIQKGWKTGWLGGVVVRASDSRSSGRGFDPWPRRCQATTLGKLFTPTCLDADSLRYYMASLKPGTFTFTFSTTTWLTSTMTRLLISLCWGTIFTSERCSAIGRLQCILQQAVTGFENCCFVTGWSLGRGLDVELGDLVSTPPFISMGLRLRAI